MRVIRRADGFHGRTFTGRPLCRGSPYFLAGLSPGDEIAAISSRSGGGPDITVLGSKFCHVHGATPQDYDAAVDVIRPVLALVHVGTAFLYVTGYLSTKTLSALAVAESDPTRRRVILGLGDKFDFRFQIVGAMLVGPSGFFLALINGYNLTQVWVPLSIIIWSAISFIGAGIWRRRSMAVRAAQDAGDDDRVRSLLTDPRARLIGWIELVLVITIVALMVLRPA